MGMEALEVSHSDVVTSADQLLRTLQSNVSWSPERLGTLLVDDGLITQDQLAQALQRQEKNGGRLGETLEQLGFVSAGDVLKTLAKKFGIPFVELTKFDFDPQALARIPIDIARNFKAFPLLFHRNRLVVAVDDPMNAQVIDMLRFVSGCSIDLALATRRDIDFAISRHYGGSDSELVVESLAPESEKLDQQAQKEAEKLSKEKPVVRMVENIFSDALAQRASDIHIHPEEDKMDVRFRIDGELRKHLSMPKSVLPAVVSRLKILANMDIAEHRLPQDGRARVTHNRQNINIRLSVAPTVKGESLVIRLLNNIQTNNTLHHLKLREGDEKRFRDLLHRSQGMVLVTGPTGSGKTTTLYAALNELRARDVNIITIEDPVEYPLEKIVQIQVNNAIGYTFPRALRQILRHDPDIIMVGEIRDRETAQIAIESSLTGHLLLSTLHTNSAAATVARLVEMGVEPYLINASLLGVFAQRLVRRICQHCRTEDKADGHIREMLKVGAHEVFYKGKGCTHCDLTGYSGRFLVYEFLRNTAEMRALLRPKLSVDEIQAQALADGMIPMIAGALEAARRGETSLSEVYKLRTD